MPPRLLIDVGRESVDVGSLKGLGEQWVDFYGLLVLAREYPYESGWISSDRLQTVGAWRYKKASSVGKEVARHLADDLVPRRLAGRMSE